MNNMEYSMNQGKVYFFHGFNPHYNKGGITIAICGNTLGGITLALAKCSPKDYFCKKTGRELAIERLNSDNALYFGDTLSLHNFLMEIMYEKCLMNVLDHDGISFEKIYNVLKKNPSQFPLVDFDAGFCEYCGR